MVESLPAGSKFIVIKMHLHGSLNVSLQIRQFLTSLFESRFDLVQFDSAILQLVSIILTRSQSKQALQIRYKGGLFIKFNEQNPHMKECGNVYLSKFFFSLIHSRILFRIIPSENFPTLTYSTYRKKCRMGRWSRCGSTYLTVRRNELPSKELLS